MQFSLFFLLLSGMTLGVDLPEVCDGEPGVVLERLQILVAEELLHVVDVGASNIRSR